ncbi:transposase [Streptomyces sp. V1I1]|uniref:transposase n=1 Tax=Streptomyces sp. V1I1 TaxID=3042272 RepID=UPI0027839579|nr:transposase [Streptomyces sp. V1I1]MDQ0945743.1 hypothetical protein [Streptomyces sp. V1I1]
MAAGQIMDPARWRAMFDQAMARIAGRFRRVEPRATARAYLLGLLSGVERKNCWQLAEQAGHARPGPMHRLLRGSHWDADAVRDEARAYILDHLGTARRIENSQVGVFLAYASSRAPALIDRRLYLPEHSWCSDAERRSAAGIPDDVAFATKPRLSWQTIAAALDTGVTLRLGDRRRSLRPGPAASYRSGGPRDGLRPGRRLHHPGADQPRPHPPPGGRSRRPPARRGLAPAKRRSRGAGPALSTTGPGSSPAPATTVTC